MANVNYRLNVRKRRNWRLIVIVTAVILLFLVILFVLIGNILKKKTDADTEKPSEGSSSTAIADSTLPYSVNAYAVDLSSKDMSMISASISELKSKGVTSVSLNFSNKEGRLLYNSSVAQSLGYQSSGESGLDPEALATKITAFGALPAGTFVLGSQNETDPKLRIVKLAYESAVVAELAEKGIKDMTLICDNLSLENAEALLRLAESAKSVAPTLNIGITLPQATMADPQVSILIDKLTEAYDFIALDLTNNGETEVCDYIDSALGDPNLRYCFIRYNVRLLIPSINDDATFERLTSILRVNSVASWQMMY
ncbi:MAG: hypothetical protein E7641_05300 [Ruminococcaceae bacterium]|nr:hypothetical protein [Oscillospiraceae bacterium]